MSAVLSVCDNYVKEIHVKINSTNNVLISCSVCYHVSLELNSISITQFNLVLHFGHYTGREYNKRNDTRGITSLIIQRNTMISRFVADPDDAVSQSRMTQVWWIVL